MGFLDQDRQLWLHTGSPVWWVASSGDWGRRQKLPQVQRQPMQIIIPIRIGPISASSSSLLKSPILQLLSQRSIPPFTLASVQNSNVFLNQIKNLHFSNSICSDSSPYLRSFRSYSEFLSHSAPKNCLFPLLSSREWSRSGWRYARIYSHIDAYSGG